MAYAYLSGNGVEQDLKKAIDYLKVGEKFNISASVHLLGVCYLEGFGIDKNVTKACEYFEKAKKLGNPASDSYLKQYCKSGLFDFFSNFL